MYWCTALDDEWDEERAPKSEERAPKAEERAPKAEERLREKIWGNLILNFFFC